MRGNGDNSNLTTIKKLKTNNGWTFPRQNLLYMLISASSLGYNDEDLYSRYHVISNVPLQRI